MFDIPILLCTGFSEAISDQKADTLDIKEILIKPIVMKNPAQKIRQKNPGRIFFCLTVNHKFIIRLSMKQIIENIYHVGDSNCSVYIKTIFQPC